VKNVLGIIFSNMHEHLVGELTAIRCMGSIPVCGRYRMIDFALSSMVNSGIKEVGIITKNNYQSLMDHLGSGREWDLARKNGGLVMLPPFSRSASGMYSGRVDALAGVMDYINLTRPEYVLCMDCDMLANMDLRPFIEAHKTNGAEISVMYSRMPNPGQSNKDQIVFDVGEDSFATDMRINPYMTGMQNVYLNVMVVRRELLAEMISDCHSRSLFYFDRAILQPKVREGKVFAYHYEGYVSRFDSLRTFFEANMALLEPENRAQLFPHNWPVYTKVRDTAPARYGLDAHVRRSVVGDGCVIEGKVENSVLFRGVVVEKGAKIKNSILMQNTRVGAGSTLDYVISDKNVKVEAGRMLIGHETYPSYISKGSSV